MRLVVDEMRSPVGVLYLVSRGAALCGLAFEDRWQRERAALGRRFGGVTLESGKAPAIRQALDEYFAGNIGGIERIAVDPGGTAFQERVWTELRRIPAGSTRTYADIASAIGQPTATRAVGMANGRNPVAIVIPCHRVIGASGKLRGYGGGVDRKRWLLEHENALSPLFAGL